MSDDEQVSAVVIRPSWSRPPFPPGNTLSTRHGAWSERWIAPLAGQLLAETLAEARRDGSPIAYLADPSYLPALRGWARVESRLELLHSWLDARTLDTQPGDLDSDGQVRGAADLATRLETQAQRARSALGLDPTSRARLGRDLTSSQVDMARLLSALDDDDPEEPTDAR